MNAFTQLQHQFQAYLINNNDDFSHEIVGTKKVSKKNRLEIYKNAYQLRLQEALTESYSILCRYLGLGSQSFDDLCVDYINAFPSSFRSIRWYGDQFSLFLKSHKKYKNMPHVSELAEWEWASCFVFDAKDADILTLEMMGSVPPDQWESLKFKLHPSLRRLNMSWNVVEIWEQLSDEKTPTHPIKNNSQIPWIIWRKELTCQYRPLSEDEAIAIDSVISGKTFGDICEGLCDFVSEDEVGQRAALLLKGWIQSGLISELN